MNLKKIIQRILLIIAISVITLGFLIPLVWVVFLSFKTNSEIVNSTVSIPNFMYVKNYIDAWKTVNVVQIFYNTALIAIIAVSLELVIVLFSSYAIARFKIRYSKIQNYIYSLFVTGLVIPVFILIFPIYKMTTSLRLTDTYLSLILPYLAMGLSFNTLLLVGGLKAFPKEIEEAGIIDGCGVLTMIYKIVLPIIKPLIATIVIFNVLGIWNEFPLASILINKESMRTVALSISKFRGIFSINYASTAAFVIIVVIPQLIFYSIFQKNIVEGMTAGAVKG